MHKMIHINKHWAILLSSGKRPRFFCYRSLKHVRLLDVGPVRLVRFL